MKGETEIEMSIVLLWEKAFSGTLVQWLALSHCYWLNIFSKQQGALWPKSIHSKIDQNKTKSYQKKVMTYNCQARTPRRVSSRRLCREVFWKPSSAECRTPSPACWSTPRWECQESLSKVGWFPPFLCRNQIWHTRKTSCTPGIEILWSNGTLLSHLIALFNILNDRGVLVLGDAGGLILGLAYLQSLQFAGIPGWFWLRGNIRRQMPSIINHCKTYENITIDIDTNKFSRHLARCTRIRNSSDY